MNTQSLSSDQVQKFRKEGYLFIEQFLSPEETDILTQVVRNDQRLMDHAIDVKDTKGNASKLTVWNHPGDDIYGVIASSHKVVDAVEQLLDDEVYHYHSKLMLKEPRVGGAWEWHQDYGYWYHNGCLYPDMLSCLIAIDRADKENGCLQVLAGSHQLGRIEHGRYGDQTGADPERVQAAKEKLALVHCEMSPGTALFFHSNLLHCSAANLSDRPRWSLICCYNAAHNDPYKKSHHPGYTPLVKVADKTIMEAGTSANSDRIFMDTDDDQTTGAEKGFS